MGIRSGRLHDAVTTAQLSAVDTQLAYSMNKPRFTMQYALSKTGYMNTTLNDNQDIFGCFYQVFDAEFKTSGAVYTVEAGKTGMTVARVFRSLDGGETWESICTIPCNHDAGEQIRHLFVEPYEQRIIVNKVTDRLVTPQENHIITYNASGYLISDLNIGTRSWHASSHNIDSCKGKDGSRIIMFGEYAASGHDNVPTLNVWRSIDRGATWTSVFTQGGNDQVPNSGEIRHFHTCQVDPYTKDWYLGSGDTESQCKIWRSQDDGLTWTLLFSGTQNDRTLGFVFEEDYFYYATDAIYANKLFKVNKTTLERTVAADLQKDQPVYSITKTFFPKGILIFNVNEKLGSGLVDDLEIKFYDTERAVLYTVGLLSLRGTTDNYNGIREASRCQCKFTGNIFLGLSPYLAYTKYGMGTPYTSHSHICKAQLTL